MVISLLHLCRRLRVDPLMHKYFIETGKSINILLILEYKTPVRIEMVTFRLRVETFTTDLSLAHLTKEEQLREDSVSHDPRSNNTWSLCATGLVVAWR